LGSISGDEVLSNSTVKKTDVELIQEFLREFRNMRKRLGSAQSDYDILKRLTYEAKKKLEKLKETYKLGCKVHEQVFKKPNHPK